MTIPETSIDVWHATASVDQPGKVELRCESWLGHEEIERANRFRRLTSRNQHVIGRGMARRLLGDTLASPAAIKFASEAYGKPYVAAPESAKQPFNIAHTEGLVMCGVGEAAHELVGIDVERIDRRTDAELGERYFSRPEVEYLNTKPDGLTRQRAFLRIWTLKESFIKAIGTGLQTPLADFAFVDIESPTPTIRMLNEDLLDDRVWKFFSIEPRPGFIGAVAVATTAEVRLDLKSFDALIEGSEDDR